MTNTENCSRSYPTHLPTITRAQPKFKSIRQQSKKHMGSMYLYGSTVEVGLCISACHGMRLVTNSDSAINYLPIILLRKWSNGVHWLWYKKGLRQPLEHILLLLLLLLLLLSCCCFTLLLLLFLLLLSDAVGGASRNCVCFVRGNNPTILVCG